MKTLTLAAALWLGLAMGAVAQSDDIRQTIRSQLDAFKSDDFTAAYDYASPTIKNVFRNPEIFGHMVQHGYPMVWRPGGGRVLGTRGTGRHNLSARDDRGQIRQSACAGVQDDPDRQRMAR